MNREVSEAAHKLIQHQSNKGYQGSVDHKSAYVELNSLLTFELPDWLIELNTTLPLCGLEIEWKRNDLNGLIEWANEDAIRVESLDCFPGIAILNRGFVNIGSDPYGTGDSYFIPTNKGNNPPVFQIYHDTSEDPDEILSSGLLEVSPRLSDLFQNAVLY